MKNSQKFQNTRRVLSWSKTLKKFRCSVLRQMKVLHRKRLHSAQKGSFSSPNAFFRSTSFMKVKKVIFSEKSRTYPKKTVGHFHNHCETLFRSSGTIKMKEVLKERNFFIFDSLYLKDETEYRVHGFVNWASISYCPIGRT